MIPDDKALSTFRDMLYIRRFEEAVLGLWEEHGTETHKHVYIGQEAVAAGILQLLRDDDRLTTTHRNHGHVLLRGADPGEMMAESLGRRGGCNKGRSGSGGITVPEAGFLFTTGQVGGGSGLATGGALAQRIFGKGGISVAFFGDGGLEEGITFESMNLAALHSLPVLYVCENNSVGVTTGRAENEWSSSSMAAQTLGDIPRSLQIETAVVDAEDVNAVYSAASDLIAKLRAGTAAPAFMEMRAHRWPGSRSFNPSLVTGATQHDWILQPESVTGEHADYINQYDPVVRYGRELVSRGLLDGESLSAIDAELDSRIGPAREYAAASDYPDPAESFNGTYA